jgi:hypothetical protein
VRYLHIVARSHHLTNCLCPKTFKPRPRQGEPTATRDGQEKTRPHTNKRTHSELTDFEIDRSTVITELLALRRAIEEGAKQIDMVADERVFDQSLSRALVRKARKLHLVARDLNGLIRLILRSRVPKTASPSPVRCCLSGRGETDLEKSETRAGAIADARANRCLRLFRYCN